MELPLGTVFEKGMERRLLFLIEVEVYPFAEVTILDEYMGDLGLPQTSKNPIRRTGPFEQAVQDVLSVHIVPVQVISPVPRKDKTNPRLFREVLIDVSHRLVLRTELCDVLVVAHFSAEIAEGVHIDELAPEILEVQTHQKNEAQPEKDSSQPGCLRAGLLNPTDHGSQPENGEDGERGDDGCKVAHSQVLAEKGESKKEDGEGKQHALLSPDDQGILSRAIKGKKRQEKKEGVQLPVKMPGVSVLALKKNAQRQNYE